MPEEEFNNKQQDAKRRITWQLIGVFVLLVLINVGASYFSGKIDLTRDHRYTITPTTKRMLRQLPEKVKVTVFLKGEDFPAAFRRLSRSSETMLQNFREISDNKVTYQFLDPLGDDTLAISILKKYRMSGIPVTIGDGKKGTSQKMIFPWALITREGDNNYDQGFPVFLQESNTPQLSRTILLKSEMLLEYNLANGIHQITKQDVPAIAYLRGNGEPFGYQVYSALSALNQFYRLDTLDLNSVTQIPNTYSAVIVNDPEKTFDEIGKFKLDQYLMHGGNLYFNVNGATGSLDSFNNKGQFNSMALRVNLDDLLYQYGVRLNHDLLTDAVNCAGIPLTPQGNNPQPTIYPWIYFPVLQAGSNHPIVKNLNGVLGRFVSTLDTNNNDPSIKKTILLCSSDYSKIEPTPTPILLESAMVQLNPASFTQKKLTAAVLLEGAFSSPYSGRMSDSLRQFITQNNINPLFKGPQTGKVIMASDGELMMNEFSQQNGPSELGAYRYSDFKFDNKPFLLNSMEYLTDPNNLLEARAKDFQNRLLDPTRTENERKQWQIINIAAPIASIVLLGLIFFFVRNKRYGA